jgi:hypothetical protein
MTVGETVQLESPALWAYGPNGCPPVVGSDTAMIFELTLLRFQRPTEEEKRAEAEALAKKAQQLLHGGVVVNTAPPPGGKELSVLGDDLFVDANP